MLRKKDEEWFRIFYAFYKLNPPFPCSALIEKNLFVDALYFSSRVAGERRERLGKGEDRSWNSSLKCFSGAAEKRFSCPGHELQHCLEKEGLSVRNRPCLADRKTFAGRAAYWSSFNYPVTETLSHGN